MTETQDPTQPPQPTSPQQDAPSAAVPTPPAQSTEPLPAAPAAAAAKESQPTDLDEDLDEEPDEEFNPQHGDKVAFKSEPANRLVVRAVRDDGTFDVQEDLDPEAVASPTGPRWFQSVAKDQLQPWNGGAL